MIWNLATEKLYKPLTHKDVHPWEGINESSDSCQLKDGAGQIATNLDRYSCFSNKTKITQAGNQSWTRKSNRRNSWTETNNFPKSKQLKREYSQLFIMLPSTGNLLFDGPVQRRRWSIDHGLSATTHTHPPHWRRIGPKNCGARAQITTIKIWWRSGFLVSQLTRFTSKWIF